MASEAPGDIRYTESEGRRYRDWRRSGEFQQEIGGHLDGKPAREDVSFVGSYRFDLD